MSPEEYNAKKTAFLKKIYLTVDEIVKIERNTIGQQGNDYWKKFRKHRLTASNFGKVCKLRPTTSRANIIKYILYDVFQGSSATRYGIENESLARNEFQKNIKEKIEPAGLFIHKNKPYLAASPDGLIGKDGILEIKCLPSIKEYTPEKAIDKNKIKFMMPNGEKITLKKNDNYYYQVQAQLNITERNYCYFVVWTPKGFIVDQIYKDVEFWTSKIEPFVTKFYMNSLLPEIIDPRFDRGLPIRPGILEKKL